jgi:trehalose-phosphatase
MMDFPESVPSTFWELLTAAKSRLLMLDYDGTLAPFHVDRAKALAPPGIITRLRSIAGGRTRIAIISGRPVRELEILIGPFPGTLVGEHGWERRQPAAQLVKQPLTEEVTAALDQAAAAVRERGLGDCVERKRTSVVLHTRGLAHEEAEATERAIDPIWRSLACAALRLSPIDGGLELRASGRDKGTAVRELLAETSHDTFPVYIGDDYTDEDAFFAVLHRGFGIRIGCRQHTSYARGCLPSWDEMSNFLHHWLAIEIRQRAAPGGRS